MERIPRSKKGMTLVEQLRDILNDYFGRFPNTSINGLAMRSTVGATTLRRILSLEIKGDPSPHTVLNIASAVSKEKRLSKLIHMFEGPVGELLRDSFSAYVEVSAPHTFDVDLNEILRDRLNYFIYKLAANRNGVTENEVKDLYGQLGLEKLKKLREQGLIKLEGVVYHASEKNFSLDLEIAKEHLPELVKFYRPENLEAGLNLFYTLSESVSLEGVKKIKEIQREAAKKVYEIMQAPEYSGNVPYFTVQLCEVLSADGKTDLKNHQSDSRFERGVLQ